MVDREARQALSTDLRRLVTGRITNDEFDECYERYFQHPDRAVASIAEFGYCLYSSNLLVPYRLKGWYALNAETRRRAAIAVLFSRTQGALPTLG